MCYMWHLICDTWQVTSEMWHLTCDMGHMTQLWYAAVWCGMVWWTYETISWSIALIVWEWLKSDILHVTCDTWHVVSKCMIYSPCNYKTIWIVSKLSIVSKSTQFLLKLDWHCNLPNFRHVSNTSEYLHLIFIRRETLNLFICYNLIIPLWFVMH